MLEVYIGVDHASTEYLCAGVTQTAESPHKTQGGLWKGTGDAQNGSGSFLALLPFRIA